MMYIIAFAGDEHINFRRAEFLSLLELHALNPSTVLTGDIDWSSPYIVASFPDDAIVSKFVQRSMLIKAVYRYWCSADSFEHLISEISNIDKTLTDDVLKGDKSFKIHVTSANKKISQEQRLQLVNSVMSAHGETTAPIKLKEPDIELCLLFEYESRALLPSFIMPNEIKRSRTDTQMLLSVYYGRFVAESKRRDIMKQFDLSQRCYLGNTSMDVCLAAVAANLGLCRSGDIVYDPFLGAGGCILAASYWGALGLGSDLDFALVHGIDRSPKAGQGARAADECLRACYKQYGMLSRFLDAFVADAALLSKTMRLPEGGLFDSIVTDPPYGVRESSKRVAKQNIEKAPSLMTVERVSAITEGKQIHQVPDAAGLVPVPHDLPHFAHKEEYPLDETFEDLLRFSAAYLVPGGRLVFWMPIFRKEFSGSHCLPFHPRLKRVSVCEQVLNHRNSRALIVMQRLQTGEPDLVAERCSAENMLSQFVYNQPHAKQKVPKGSHA